MNNLQLIENILCYMDEHLDENRNPKLIIKVCRF